MPVGFSKDMVTFDKNGGKIPYSGTVGLVGWGALSHGLAFWLSQIPNLRVAAVGRRGLVEGRSSSFPCRISGEGKARSRISLQRIEPEQWDLALICTRAPDLLLAARQWLPRLRTGIPVGVLCNGRVEEELRILRAEFPQFLWRQGVAFFGAREEDDGWLISGGGKVLFGSLTTAPTVMESSIFQSLAAAGFTWVQNPQEAVREKWWLNTVLNTLCARWRLAENRIALQYPNELRQLGEETYALGEELDGPWPQDLSYYQSALQTLILATAANENSLARALRLNLPHENAYLGGVVKSARGAYSLLREYVEAMP